MGGIAMAHAGFGEFGYMERHTTLRSGASIRICARIEFRNRRGRLTGVYQNDHDITLFQLTQFIQSSYLAVNASSIKETGGTTQAVTGAITSNTPSIAFGKGVTAAAYTDFAIQTTAGALSDIIAAASSAATSGANTWTITATWTNTTAGTIAISELALYVTTTAGVAANKTYCLTHDVITGQNVSPNGTALATLTWTMG
jgi:hypothetical protein